MFSTLDDNEIPMSPPPFRCKTTTIDNEEGGGSGAAAAATQGLRGFEDGVGYGGIWADFDWTGGYGDICGDSEEGITCTPQEPPGMLRQVAIRHSATRGGSRRDGGVGRGPLEDGEIEDSPAAGEAAAATFLPQSRGRQRKEREEQGVPTTAARSPPSPMRGRRRSSTRRGSVSPRSAVSPTLSVPPFQPASPPRFGRIGSTPPSSPSPSAASVLPGTIGGDYRHHQHHHHNPEINSPSDGGRDTSSSPAVPLSPADSAAGSNGKPAQRQRQQGPRPPAVPDEPRTTARDALYEGNVAGVSRQMRMTVDRIQDPFEAGIKRRSIALGPLWNARAALEGKKQLFFSFQILGFGALSYLLHYRFGLLQTSARQSSFLQRALKQIWR